MLRNCVRYQFCLDKMVSSKLHTIKEKDYKRENIYYESTSVFSKEKGSKKYKLLDVKVPDINTQKTEFYIFDKNTVPVPRQVYIAPLRKYVKQKLQRDEFNQFKRDQTTIKEEVVEQIDELWGKNPPNRYLERAQAKDLFFNYRSPRFAQYNKRKNDFLSNPSANGEIVQIISQIKSQSQKELSRIFHPNYFIEDHYKKLPDIFYKLKEAVQQAHFKEMPAIAWMLQNELLYKDDIFKIWQEIEKIALPQIHHYTIDELLLLKRGLATTYPKAGSYELHNIIYNLVSQEKLSVNQSIEALYAFRTFNTDKFAKVLIENLIQKLPEYKDNHSKLAQAFYSIANNLPKKHLRVKSLDVTSNDKYRLNIMNQFVGPLKQGQYNMDDITRILLGVSILKVPNFDDLIFHLENQISEPDEYQLVHILYALSKGSNGFQTGQLSTYQYLEQFVWKYFDQYEHLEKSRIYYAYSAINSDVAKDERFISWISENMLKFSHSELQNVVYGLMFNNVNDKTIWANFYQNVAYKNEYVPLANYFAYKQVKFFTKQFFPDWNMKPFEDACYTAETMFLADRTERKHFEQQHVEFQIDLNTHVQYEWKPYFNWHNTYLFNITLPEHRIAIILNTPQTSLYGKPRPQLLLQQQIMATLDWKLIIFDRNQLYSMKIKERAEYLKKTIDEAIESQKEKMILWEDERRAELYEQLLFQAESSITPGKKYVTKEDLKGLSKFPV